MMRSYPAVAFVLLTSCAGSTLPYVVDARDIAPAESPPTILRVRDMGTALIPSSGPIDGLSDASAGPGELLVVEGDRFGRLPTVLIGSRPAAVLARTRGGGIVVRVPRGTRVGNVDVTVSTQAGSARMAATVRRLAVLLESDRLDFVSIGDDGAGAEPKMVSTMPMSGGRQLRMDGSGAVAYVLAEGPTRIAVVDLGRTAPALLGALPLTHRANLLAVAAEASRAVAIGDGKLSVVDTTSVRRPVLFDAASLPKDVAGARAAELSPDGKTLALLTKSGNRIVALDVSNPTAPALLSSVDVLPNEKQNLVRALAFAPDGQTLWVVSGASAETHPQVIPTRITAVKLVATASDGAPADAEAPRAVDNGKRQLAVWKTQFVTNTGAPISLVVGNAPDAQGSAIRSTPEVATVYLTAAKPELFDLKKADLARVRSVLGEPNVGLVARAELGSGGGPIATTHELLGALVLVPGGAHVVAAAVRASADAIELGVASITLDGQATVRFAPLGSIAPARVAAPFTLGGLAIQP